MQDLIQRQAVMSEEKEIERLMGIVREHARAALAKPVTQREHHLALCRAHWKRYAAGLSKRSVEQERFAATLDRATRDMIALIEESGGAVLLEDRDRLQFARDSVEGAMDSVIAYEAAIEPVEPEPAAAEANAADLAPAPAEDAGIAAERSADTPETPVPPPSESDLAAAVAALEEDRQSARYGFSPHRISESAEPAGPPPDPELLRKVREVLRSHRQTHAKPDDGN